jgi:hypothetical protein
MASPTTPTTPIYDPADKNKDGYISEAEFKAAHPDKVNAYETIVTMFSAIGITGDIDDVNSLPGWIANTIKTDPTLLDNKALFMSELYKSEPYKQRFSGLTEIRKNNASNPTNPMVVPSEAEYLQRESTYKQILSPVKSMYGASINAEIGMLIAKNISPIELQDRVTVANSWVMSQDANLKAQLQTYYGIGDNELLGYALNPDLGLSQIQKAAGAAQLGAQALASAVDLNMKQSEDLVVALTAGGMAKDAYQAGQKAAEVLQDIASGTATAYNPLAGSLTGVQRLAGMEGTQLGTSEVLGAALGVNTEAATKIGGLKSRERARFEGASGGTNVLAEQVSGTV